MNDAFWWFCLNIFSLAVLAFFSMMEMACVSFNKVRLQYYVSKNMKRAIWLNFLLQHPAYLFGATLMCVNAALMVGSDSSRQFFIALGLNPDFSPIFQVIIVVIFAELAPMFAARRYAEHVSMLGIPLLYACAKIMTPILYCLSILAQITSRIFGGKDINANLFPTQEELQKILEEHDEDHGTLGETDDFNILVSQIFRLRGSHAKQLMESLEDTTMFPSNDTVGHVRDVLLKKELTFFPVYHREVNNIIGIAYSRDLIRASDSRRIRDFARAPWFVTQNTSVMQILKQFRRNNQTVAVILNDKGNAIGFLTLEDIVEEIFGNTDIRREPLKALNLIIVERTLPGSMTIVDFKQQFGVTIEDPDVETLSDLLIKVCCHIPEIGESIYIDPYEIKVKETSIVDVKTVTIKTKVK